MKSSTTSFLLVSYVVSLLETLALIGIPALGLYVLATSGGIVAGVLVAIGFLVLGAAIVGLASFESVLAQDVKDDRTVRSR